MASCCCSRGDLVHRYLQGFAPGTSLDVLAAGYGGLRRTPPGLDALYQRMLTFARERGRRISRVPVLACSAKAGGMIAFCNDQVGLILMGLDEIENLVQSMWKHHLVTLRPVLVARCRLTQPLVREPSDDTLYATLRDLAIEVILAHEVDHIGQDPAQPRIEREKEADRFSAAWCARRGLPREIGELLFTLLGCVSEQCNYPRPKARGGGFVAAYDTELARILAERAPEMKAAAERVQHTQESSGSGGGWAILGGVVGAVAIVGVGAAIINALSDEPEPEPRPRRRRRRS